MSPFGNDCEFADFDACVAHFKGKVADPKAYCAVLQSKTEAHCKDKKSHSDVVWVHHFTGSRSIIGEGMRVKSRTQKDKVSFGKSKTTART